MTQNFTKLLAGQRSVSSLWSSSGGDGADTKRLNPRDQERADHLQHVMATEIVVDLLILSEATTLVGLCMSQIARAAAAVGVTRGTMKDLVALDFENIPVRDQWKFGEDEGWRPPQKPRQAEAMAKSGLDTAAYTWEGDC